MKANVYDDLRQQVKESKKENKKEVKKEVKKDTRKEVEKKVNKEIKKKTKGKQKIKKERDSIDEKQEKKIEEEAKKEVEKNTYIDPDTVEFKKLAEKAKKRREKELKKKTPLQTIKQMSVKQRRKLIIFSILIGYACFLLFGLANSNFVINDDGIAMPVAKSTGEVQEMTEYKLVKSYYDDAQKKYKEILQTDIDMAQNPNSVKLIATRYNGYLKWYDTYLTQLKGIEVSDQYTFVKEELISWASNDICVYLQNITDAISSNNQETAANALEDRTRSINDFNTITDTLSTIAINIKGADLRNLDFNPDKYYSELGGGGN